MYYCAVRPMSEKVIGIVSAAPDYVEFAAATIAAWKAAKLTVVLWPKDKLDRMIAEYGF